MNYDVYMKTNLFVICDCCQKPVSELYDFQDEGPSSKPICFDCCEMFMTEVQYAGLRCSKCKSPNILPQVEDVVIKGTGANSKYRTSYTRETVQCKSCQHNFYLESQEIMEKYNRKVVLHALNALGDIAKLKPAKPSRAKPSASR